MDKDSIPEDTLGDESHSPTNDSADTTDNNQSSNEEDNQFWNHESEEEQEETSDDAPSQTQDTDDDTEETQEDSVDPELKKWANSQNLSLETETEIKLAKRLRDTQKSLHEKSAEAKQRFTEASNETTEGNQLARIEARLARSDFFEANPDAKAIEGEMFDYAVSVRDSGDVEGFKYFQTPQGWKSLYRIVKAEQAEVQSEDSYSAGRTDERKNLAKKQQASTSSRNANNSAPTDSKITEDKIAKMSIAEYTKFRNENPNWNPFSA